MNLQTLQVFLKLLNIFLEYLQAVQGNQSFRIFFYEFTKSPALPEVAKHFPGTTLKFGRPCTG